VVLGYSRLIWGRFVVHQDLQSVLGGQLLDSQAFANISFNGAQAFFFDSFA
jgi:hypothetical protein